MNKPRTPQVPLAWDVLPARLKARRAFLCLSPIPTKDLRNDFKKKHAMSKVKEHYAQEILVMND